MRPTRTLLALAAPLVTVALTLPALGCDDEDDPSNETSPWPGYELLSVIGESGEGRGQLRTPMGVAVDESGRIWVADTGNRRVQVFESDGRVARVIDQVWSRPLDVAIMPDGTVWVADLGADVVRCLTPEGEPCDADSFEVSSPAGVGARERQGPLAVELHGHRVESVTGSPSLSVGGHGGGSGQLSHPTDVAVLEDGGFLVADAYNHRVQRYDARGRAAGAWTGPIERPFQIPTGIAVLEGVTHVADSGGRRVVALGPDGRVLAQWGLTDDHRTDIHSPVRVAARRDRVYVADAANDRVVVLRRAAPRE